MTQHIILGVARPSLPLGAFHCDKRYGKGMDRNEMEL